MIIFKKIYKMQVDENHMDKELQYLLTNPRISQIKKENNSRKEIKYIFYYLNISVY